MVHRPENWNDFMEYAWLNQASAERRDRLPSPYRAEHELAAALLQRVELSWPAVQRVARPWVQAVRERPAPFWALESLLHDYPISSAEGSALMRLAEALLRVPDLETAIALTADQLGKADFHAAAGSPHPLLAGLSSSAIAWSKKWLPDAEGEGGLLKRLGAQTVVAAAMQAIQLLGRQFVLGRDIGQAIGHACSARRDTPGLRYSYDMLGEGARTEADAERYLAAYLDALGHIAASGGAAGPQAGDGMSIKLSALFSRYEEAQRKRVFRSLLPRLWRLVLEAARADINLTIDAEESERLELSLEVFDALARRAALNFPRWNGLGLAVQAYQTRALAVVDEVACIARRNDQRLMVRLVKGAYWDGEIKRAQEQGLAAYPVFTHKHHTDLSYLACAAALIGQADRIYPQFATHHAGTIAAVAGMAQQAGARCELQRLHGMGEGVYREAMKTLALPVRVYAPVGEHRDLLAYLVRRLLENGANSSFVHQLTDDTVPVETLLASPLRVEAAPGLALPRDLYGSERPNSLGVDLAVLAERAPIELALRQTCIEEVPRLPPEAVAGEMQRLQQGFEAWNARPLGERAAVLRRAAERLESRLPEFCGLLVKEARKTLPDAVSEVREAVDFCRYYALEAERRLAPQALPGPTGESNLLSLHGRGVFVCISPWNFPLAIFAGQVVAALVCGNAVAAKPAELTPAVALRFVGLLHAAGVPADALALLHGPGGSLGAALVADPHTAGVCFTGSTGVARGILRRLAELDGPIVPLIAETGGINAMLVDSSALPEQVVDAVLQSAFRSAGQRCSALRLLCLHESMADSVLAMLAGAMQELVVGDPALRETDVGPVIDEVAAARLRAHIARLEGQARRVADTPLPSDPGEACFVAPVVFERTQLGEVDEEIFGPVLQVVRWSGQAEAVIDRINRLGYGLTLGIQSRIDSRARRLAQRAQVGNVYVNRNMIGAVVGVQPFGGEGLSGTGPKAGGPHYLYRFCSERCLTINTAAAGGNAELLAGPGLHRP